ncbi:MAG: hypothetical protein BJ554DRAFT_991, partial [Olpidium bornovanus]
MADSADVFAALRSPQSPRTSLAAARPEDPFDPGIWNQAGFAPLHVAVAACAEAGDPEKASVVELLLRQVQGNWRGDGPGARPPGKTGVHPRPKPPAMSHFPFPSLRLRRAPGSSLVFFFPSVCVLVLRSAARKFNVDVHVRDASGNTPLHTAAATGSGDAANLLLSAGADPFPANLDGRLPVACA